MNDVEFKNIVRRGFNEASAGYDKPAMKFFDKSAEYLVESLNLKGHEHLFDVATGTGKTALAAARRLTTGRVLGVDLSEGMLQCAQAKARQSGLSNVSFQCADIDSIHLPQDAFDGVTCSFGVFFFSDMPGVIHKLMGALKPGGFIGITSFADGSFRPHADLTLDRFKRYGIKLPESYTWQRLDSHDKHEQLLKNAGLKNIRTQTQPMGYYLNDAGEWWDIVTYTGFRSFLNQLSPENAKRYQQEHLPEISRTAEGNKGIKLTVDVIFSTGFKSERKAD